MEISNETYQKELRRLQSMMLEVEAGLGYLNPRSQTFQYEYPMFEKRINHLANSFTELIRYLPKFTTHEKGNARQQLKRLMEVNNRITLKLNFLKPEAFNSMASAV
jgi:hypothetical protein